MSRELALFFLAALTLAEALLRASYLLQRVVAWVGDELDDAWQTVRVTA